MDASCKMFCTVSLYLLLSLYCCDWCKLSLINRQSWVSMYIFSRVVFATEEGYQTNSVLAGLVSDYGHELFLEVFDDYMICVLHSM